MNESTNTLQVPVKHWTEVKGLHGNTFTFKPSPEMLVEGGVHKLRTFNPMGRKGSRVKQSQTFYVIYDEAYVIAWLKSQVLDGLTGIPYNHLQKLFSEALKQRDKERKERGKQKT